MDWIAIIKGAVIPFVILATVPIMIWIERRGSAFIQDRLGPNRAKIGPVHLAGLPHMLADGIKFVTKESFVPEGADKPFYYMAPFFAVAPVMATMAVVPFADSIVINGREVPIQGIPLETGIIFFFALASLSVYAIVLGGWSSNNRYSLLGGLRSSAQLVSYEVALGLTIIPPLMIYNTSELNQMVLWQTPNPIYWGFFLQPVGFLLFLVAGVAETERAPFDMPEAESEIVAGFHTEYSGLKFSMFMLGQYVTTLVLSCILVTVFFGGWQVPFLSTAELRNMVGMYPTAVIQFLTFGLKMFVMFWIFVWLRWTLPRFRYDQLMHLGWKIILPLAIANIFITGVVLLLI